MPESFVHKYQNLLHQRMKLRIHTGETWDVSVDVGNSGEWYFNVGWGEFARDVKLERNQLVVFWLNVIESTFNLTFMFTL